MTHTIRATLRVALVAALVGAGGSCYHPTVRTSPFGDPASADGANSVRVRVENQNFGDATVHAVHGGERIRLGQVSGKSQKEFRVPWSFSDPMEFRIDIVGGRGCGIRPLTVDPGDRVSVRIPSEIGQSPCFAIKG